MAFLRDSSSAWTRTREGLPPKSLGLLALAAAVSVGQREFPFLNSRAGLPCKSEAG